MRPTDPMDHVIQIDAKCQKLNDDENIKFYTYSIKIGPMHLR